MRTCKQTRAWVRTGTHTHTPMHLCTCTQAHTCIHTCTYVLRHMQTQSVQSCTHTSTIMHKFATSTLTTRVTQNYVYIQCMYGIFGREITILRSYTCIDTVQVNLHTTHAHTPNCVPPNTHACRCSCADGHLQVSSS
jgi:hypothetical protein